MRRWGGTGEAVRGGSVTCGFVWVGSWQMAVVARWQFQNLDSGEVVSSEDLSLMDPAQRRRGEA